MGKLWTWGTIIWQVCLVTQCCQKATSPCCQKATLCSILCPASPNSYFLTVLFYILYLKPFPFLFLSSFIVHFIFLTCLEALMLPIGNSRKNGECCLATSAYFTKNIFQAFIFHKIYFFRQLVTKLHKKNICSIFHWPTISI